LGEKSPVEEKPAITSLYAELAELYERAHRAMAEAQQLSADLRFIRSWKRMRPRSGVRPSPLLE
jgi:hypothetical protein